MEPRYIRSLADLSIRRGCGFALIGIFTAMVGFSADPYLAIRIAAFFVTLAAVVLYWRGRNAPRRDFRHTEVWVMLQLPSDAMPKDQLQRLIGGALAESYFAHARPAAWTALALWLLALGIWAVRQL